MAVAIYPSERLEHPRRLWIYATALVPGAVVAVLEQFRVPNDASLVHARVSAVPALASLFPEGRQRAFRHCEGRHCEYSNDSEITELILI